MKKLYFLVLIIILTPLFSSAQNLEVFKQKDLQPIIGGNTNALSDLTKVKQQKAYRDTIFYEDFDSLSVVTNWTIVDNSGNGTPWIWAPQNTAPGGQFSTNVGPLTSTSDTNGYMLLPADLYNTPTPAGGFFVMYTYFQTGPIDLRDTNNLTRKSVEVSWEQSFRWCCSLNSDLALDVSTDGINWTRFDATDNVGGNFIWPNGQMIKLDVSSVLANQPTGYFRFRSESNTHYYWMIDDFIVSEGPANNLEIGDPEITFHPNSLVALQPQYFQVPASNVPSISFQAEVFNGGGNTQTGIYFKTEAFSDSLIGGGPGLGLQYVDSNIVNIGSSGTLAPFVRDTAMSSSPFSSGPTSHYTLDFSVISDSINQEPTEAIISRPLTLNDSTIALERGEDFFDGTIGPGGFAASGGIGDVVAALMVVDTAAGSVVPSTISYYVPSERADDINGITISPRIYKFNDALFLSNPTAFPIDSFIQPFCTSISTPFMIDTCTSTCPPNQNSIMDTWINLDVSSCPLMTPGAYYFGFEQTAGSGDIWGARDPGAEEQATIWSNIMYLSAAPGWGWGGFVIGLRFNGIFPPPISTTISESKASDEIKFKLYPNPNKGLFTLEVSSSQPTIYNMNVRNMVGQTVMSEAINVNGNTTKNIDLSSFDKGVYFVTLENGEDRLVRKVVVK